MDGDEEGDCVREWKWELSPDTQFQRSDTQVQAEEKWYAYCAVFIVVIATTSIDRFINTHIDLNIFVGFKA